MSLAILRVSTVLCTCIAKDKQSRCTPLSASECVGGSSLKKATPLPKDVHVQVICATVI